MKLAILSDIHGNHYALERVLQCAVRENISKLLILGDFVGYYYHPDKVMDLLSGWDFTAVRGNHEELLKSLIHSRKNGEEIKKKYGSGHRIAIEKLSSKQIEYLTSLPEKIEISIGGYDLLLSHGTPWEKSTYLYPNSNEVLLEKCDFYDANFIFVGHSHHAFCHTSKNGTILINVGSVGQSRNQSGTAQWTILDTVNGVFQMRSTPYDITMILEEISLIDPENEFLRNVLIRNSYNYEI